MKSPGIKTDCAILQRKKMNKTMTALYLTWLLCTQGYFQKEKAMSLNEISQRTFCRAIAEIKTFLIEYNIPKELVYEKKTARYLLRDISC